MKANCDKVRVALRQGPPATLRSRMNVFMRMFMFVSLLVVSDRVTADNFLQNPSNFTAVVQGIDRIRFTLPTQYDGNQNEGISKGFIYISEDGGTKQQLLKWGLGDSYNNLTSNDESGKVTIRVSYDGDWQLVGKVKGGYKYFAKNTDVQYTLAPNDDDDDHFSTTVEWTVPRELRGKNLKFYLWCQSEDISHTWYIPADNSNQSSYYEMGTWDCPAAAEVSITLNEAMLSYDAERAGTVFIPYTIQAKSVKSAKIYYTDAQTGNSYSQVLSAKLMDFAYLPSDRPWKDIYIQADLVDAEGKGVSASSLKMATKMLHYPKDLKVKIQADGEVKLTWKVDDADLDDFETNDYFEVQRNVKGVTQGSDDGWTTISMEEMFIKGQDTYTFTDNTLLDRYEGKAVTYRVRRSATTLWKWVSGSGYTIRTIPTALSLPGFSDAFVERTDTWNDEEHIVKFYYASGPKYDSKGNFIIRNESDWSDFVALVQKGQKKYSNAVMVLSDEADWDTFAKRVNMGAQQLGAVMLTDLDIADSQARVGTETVAYTGTFNGLGNTLTVNYSGDGEYLAPFTSVGGRAAIHDLTVDGRIASSGKFAGGLIGRVDDGADIEIWKCNIAADIVSSVNGDASSGGVIGYVQGGTVYIKNTAFSGSIQGDNCNCNGGFIGVVWAFAKVDMVNCLFDPSSLPTDASGCATFARYDSQATVNFTNCYYTSVYGRFEDGGKSYFVLQKQKDWERLDELVKNAGGKDVNIILATDITVTEPLGSLGYVLNGIFDGNGHTLTVGIDRPNDVAMAPFNVVGNAEIKNLTVQGSVTGGMHAAGLIGYGINGTTVNVSNVVVSVAVKTTGKYAGGLVGHGNKASFNINNCRFDGVITNTGGSTSYAGAIMGWGESGASNRITNCLEMGAYIGVDHAGMNYSSNMLAYGNGSGSMNNYSAHNWGEMGDSKYRNVSDNSSLALALGSQWLFSGDRVMPRMGEKNIVSQGIAAQSMTAAQMQEKLGAYDWAISNNTVIPAMTTTISETSYNITLWDKRAKLLLNVKMKGENGTTVNTVDLSGNEDAINKHEFTYNLSRKCVDYDFDLLVSRGTSPLPIAGEPSDTLVYSVTKKETGEQANYKFMNLNQVTSFTQQKKQSSVRLEWEVTGGDNDYYRLLRREHSNRADAEWTDTVANNIIQQFYDDNTVLVQHVYDYRLESVLLCEGTHITTADLTGAQCEPTGRVSGYVRMADGTAIAGVVMKCEPGAGVTGASSEYTTTTDETGFFEFTNLPYQTNGRYYITAFSTEGGFTGPNSEGMVVFSPNSNWTQNFNFYLDTYYVYSGNVFYRDTSIPVPGVSFKLDGNLMHDASQKVITTNSQGAFSLSIPRGPHHVQAVKEGHSFAADGYLINEDARPGEDKTKYNFEKNVSGIFLWDSTTVVLRGRVVGGEVQGNMPLGQSLSTNNLGDSLKIVMQLEGDNASYLIRKQDDETIKSADYKIAFGKDDKDTTEVNVTRHTLTIKPDSKTGEYQLELHPAKYKVIEVSAQGYATLFQQGKVGETLDLMNKVQGDVCEYNRIYRAVPTVDVKQFNSGDEPYFGVKRVTASDNIGNNSPVKVWYWKKLSDTDSIGVYSFGKPVFMAGSPYGWMLQACEKYYYNNNVNATPDIVKLDGGRVTIKNGLVGDSDTQYLDLDKDGGASYVFTPQNTTFMLAEDAALKNVSITLEYDNSFFDIKPMDGKIFQAYVMATLAKPQGRRSIVSSMPQLIDVLRDPPGGGSSAYIETGSKLSYTYNCDINGSAGVVFNLHKGENANIYNGLVIIPQFGVSGTTAGTFTENTKKDLFNIDAITYYGYTWNWSYNFDVTERIQTSSAKKWIGSKADLFIGMTTDVMVEDAIAVRVVPDSIYQIYKTHEGGTFKATDGKGNTANVKVQTGTTKVLAEGIDDTGEPVYLLRDEVLAVGPNLKSTFVHSQHFIENELLPDLLKVRNSLILPMGTSSDYAQSLANRKKHSTYVSKVPVDDVSFGYTGSYLTFNPDEGLHGDSIQMINQTVESWLYILAANERDKIEVSESDLVKRYDFDGAASIQYSESFSATRTDNRSLRYPGINDAGQVVQGAWTILTTFCKAAKNFFEISGQNAGNKPGYLGEEGLNGTVLEMQTGGSYLSLKVSPAVTLNLTDKSGKSNSDSKKIGFTLSASSKSSLTVDVYRKANEQTLEKTANPSFANITIDMLDDLRTGKLGSNAVDFLGNSEKVYSSFVYRTRGGVTCEPYEDARSSKWYQPGTVIDVATIPADKPRVWIDEPVVSNVPYDEPARFTLHFANESEYPERASLIFNYYLLASSNPDGAKVYVDGMPITTQGVNVVLYPCRDGNNNVNVFTKQIEVYPGKEFDYNDLTLCLYDPEDANRVFNCKFSAHFVPTAGKVNISSPGDKWVVNTESPYDGVRKQWYMPVKIDGFDVNYRGFDHIELQYKLSTQGDKDWVSVCSYYADKELMAKVSGVTDTIPDNGTIIAKFYGENDPIEQYYDVRAVSYCRHGNGFLTRASDILTGIKDTRLPTVFGTPEPTSGILGIGDDILMRFSEPIAGNYLRNINNFEVLGTLNSDDVTTFTSLDFGDFSIGASEGQRNLSGKSFTVDIMINPANENRQMTVFSHGNMEKGLAFGVSPDHRLTAIIDGVTVMSDSIVEFNNSLHQVAYALDQSGEGMTVNFFDGSKPIGSKELEGKHELTSKLRLGFDLVDYDNMYRGQMLEFRLWNRAMTSSALAQYGYKKLTGFESGLLDYYPMNEGSGEWCYDKAPGSKDISLLGTSWKRPSGISMQMKGDKGLLLKGDKFLRTADHDYTLMFWFRTSDSECTIFSNGDAQQGHNDQLNIGITDNLMYVRSDGFERQFISVPMLGEWHHFAMTVNRSQNVANVYVDTKLAESFPADSIGGIVGDHVMLGATYVDKGTSANAMTGFVDEVGMFSSVLPANLIKEYSTHTPIGTMSALMAYLDFGRSEKMDNNSQHLEPTGISLKRYVDSQGNIVARRDTLAADADITAFASRESYAPMVSNAQLDNINYNFVANNNELFIDIIEPDYMVEKNNIYVTVKEVPDLQGNLMASPVTLNLYAYRNPLRWDVKRIDRDLHYGEGDVFEATVKNLSSVSQDYKLEDIPVWVTASHTAGNIPAMGEQKITFTVSEFINYGTYDEQISLVGFNSMTEPLPITLKVRGDAPDWAVSNDLKQMNQTMMMVARVKIEGVVASSTESILAAFDENQQILGVTHLEVNDNANANEPLAYLTIYGYTRAGKSPTLTFRFYDAPSGSIFNLDPESFDVITFQRDAMIGTAMEPVVLVKNPSDRVQPLHLKQGWNWVTFLSTPKEGTTVGEYLNGISRWEVGDKISGVNGSNVQQWTCREDKSSPLGYRWDDEDQPMNIDNELMYNVYSMTDKTVYLQGNLADFSIDVHRDWNRIAYFPTINLPIAQALNDYTEQASEGDVIKSQEGFAVASQTSTGIIWKGSLKFMEVGKGYMLKRLDADTATFSYPIYYNDTRYSGGDAIYSSPRTSVNTINTMNMVATVSGVDIETGDRLVVYSSAERLTEAIADGEQLYFLNIGSDTSDGDALTFAIERDGETIAMTGSNISYAPNKVIGSPDKPTDISFIPLDKMPLDGKWYTVGGILIGNKPSQSGVYIHNGKAVVIK